MHGIKLLHSNQISRFVLLTAPIFFCAERVISILFQIMIH